MKVTLITMLKTTLYLQIFCQKTLDQSSRTMGVVLGTVSIRGADKNIARKLVTLLWIYNEMLDKAGKIWN